MHPDLCAAVALRVEEVSAQRKARIAALSAASTAPQSSCPPTAEAFSQASELLGVDASVLAEALSHIQKHGKSELEADNRLVNSTAEQLGASQGPSLVHDVQQSAPEQLEQPVAVPQVISDPLGASSPNSSVQDAQQRAPEQAASTAGGPPSQAAQDKADDLGVCSRNSSPPTEEDLSRSLHSVGECWRVQFENPSCPDTTELLGLQATHASYELQVRAGSRGFINKRNNCYLNAAVSALAAVPCVRDWVDFHLRRHGRADCAFCRLARDIRALASGNVPLASLLMF